MLGEAQQFPSRGARGRDLRTPAIAIAIAIVVAWLATFVGATPAIDQVVRRSYYAVRGPRTTSAVLFVAIDEHTATAWGPPPWPWSRYVELIRPLHDSGARLIALVEPGPRVVAPSALPAELRAGVAAGWLVIPGVSAGYRQPAVVLDPAGVVVAVDLGGTNVADASITRAVVEQLGGAPAGTTLPVNYIGTPEHLPTIPADHVAANEIPPSTFRGRVIVIGLRGTQFTASVPTPVGPMSPAEVHAHALDGLLDDAVWTSPPVWVAASIIVLVAVFGVVGLRRMRSTWLLVATLVVTGVACYVAGYAAFRYACIEISIGGPWITLVAAMLAGLILERRDTLGGVAELQRQIKRRLQAGAALRPGATEIQILDHFADALRTQLPLTSCVWAELPAGTWHVVFSRWYDGSDADVFERRRDVRRDPYRLPYGSHRAEWANREFIRAEHGQRSLLVPIAGFGRLLGFWIVNLPVKGGAISPSQLRVLETLADDFAITLSQQQLEWHPRDVRATGSRLTGALDDAVAVARHDAMTLAQVQDRTRTAFVDLPVGVLTATSWGMMEDCNAAMADFLTAAGIDRSVHTGFASLIAALAATSIVAARDSLRDLVIVGGTLRFVVTIPCPEDVPRIYDLAVTRVGGGPQGERIASALVMCATVRAPETRPARVGDAPQMGRMLPFKKPATGDD